MWLDGQLGNIHSEGPPVSYFNPDAHHTGNKTFSAFYGNKVIEGKEGEAGARTDELLEMILPVQIHRQKTLYLFVAAEISDLAEVNIITPLAAIIKGNNYNIRIALKALLSSAHFSSGNYGIDDQKPHGFYFGTLKF